MQQETREKWKAWGSDDGSCGLVPEFLPHPSVEETVQDFYVAFHEQNTQRLDELLASQCAYLDLVFYGPHEGKENVINFLQAAREAMGKNIHIVIEDIKSEHLTATARMHLSWKEYKMPFTNGYRYFTFEKYQGRLLISKITGVKELPVRPSEVALRLLKAIGALFDRYPLAAEMMLKAYGAEEGKHADMHFDLFGRGR
ncbi:uncharacterized protein LOC129294119 [Prosopis cineraria]|uniref:uncharacterized protein LOC129294119 n=1 Tax=Prosopis cineraria TaxID=364024 RepID=UPI00240EBECE|nr:uncharacterized protein LOC129294119 [Prosopis cineraria]